MPTNLFARVQTDLLPAIEHLSMRVSHLGGPWRSEVVDLDRGDLRIRLTKQWGVIEILFGSFAEPLEWYNSSELLSHMQYQQHDFTNADAGRAVDDLRVFLITHGPEVARLFDNQQYWATRKALLAIRRNVSGRSG